MTKPTSLKKAIAIQQNAAQYRFDWTEIEPVFAKLHEEIDELKEAIKLGDRDNIMSEFGDILFVAANLARHLDIDPDVAIEKTNTKFNNRFDFVLQTLNITNTQHEHSLDAMDQQWDISKKHFP